TDGKKLDIGIVQPNATDAGGYANAAAQDDFCANTFCWITTVYDQSGHKNDLTQAPRGGTGVPTMMGGFNSLPLADMAPVTVMATGEPHHWASLGGDAQAGNLKVMYDGRRVDNRYDPMRKQGAIVLGNGGDNSNSSQCTFYEGAMTAPNTFPTNDIGEKVQ